MRHLGIFQYEVNVPLSRFRRELNSWIRFIDKNPENSIMLTRNNNVVAVVVSPSRYKELKKFQSSYAN